METPNNDSVPTPAEQSAANELSVADRQVNILRDKLRHIDRQLAAATQNNSKLVAMLETAKAEILRLKNALDQEGQPPYSFPAAVQLRYDPPAEPAAATRLREQRAGRHGGIGRHFQRRAEDEGGHQPAR
ncbi:MAG: arc [Arthrobacter sp.]|nr:arc [Arthrobacter sp.]